MQAFTQHIDNKVMSYFCDGDSVRHKRGQTHDNITSVSNIQPYLHRYPCRVNWGKTAPSCIN